MSLSTSWRRGLFAAAVITVGTAGPSPCWAQDGPPANDTGVKHPDHRSAVTLNTAAMGLIREGKWSEGLRVAEQARDRAESEEERAEAWLLIATARLRLKEMSAFPAAMQELEQRLALVDSRHWLHAETARLRAEAELRGRDSGSRNPGGQGSMGGTGGGADLGGALWHMRYSASQRDWAKTLMAAREILAREGLNDSARADAMLHEYAALRKLGPVDEAVVSLARFEALTAGMLDHGPAMRMALLRRSMGDAAAEEVAGAFSPGEDPYWRAATPEEAGMDAALLREHEAMARLSGADGVLVARGGRIVSEWYSPLYDEPVPTMSSVKSIAALLAGLLVAEGKLSVDDPVSKYVPEWSEGERARVTVRHLLNMTAGLPKRSDMGVSAAGPGGMNAYVIALRPEWEPGTKWAYSNEGAQLLSPVLERAAGEELSGYAARRLFAPMELRATEMKRDSVGGTSTYADARTTLRELAKFGELVRARGRWNGREILPESWIAEMVSPCPVRAEYGYLWWLYESPKVVAMEGYLNTSVWVFPELDLVVARVQREPYLHAAAAYDARKMFGMMERAVKK